MSDIGIDGESRKEIITERIKNWFEGSIPGPYQIEINPTNKCELDCLPCFVRGKSLYKPDEELGKKRYMEIIEEASDMGVKEWMISGGGEPMSKPDLTMDIIREIRDKGMNGSISTSGAFFNKEMIKEIVNLGWKKIQISMNGPDKKTDNYLRGEEVFDATVKNLKTLRDIKNKRDENFPEIHITPVLTSENYDKLTDFVELCDKLDVDFLRIQPFMSDMLPNKQPGPDNSREEFSEDLEIKDHQIEDLVEEVKLAQDAISNTGIGHNLESIESKYSEKDDNKEMNKEDVDDEEGMNGKGYNLSSIPCYFPWHVLHIDAQGNATPCPQEPVKMNVKNHSLRQIWESDKFEDLRERIACNFLSGKCKYCCPVLDNDNQEIRSYMKEVFEEGELEVSPKIVESFREKHRVYNKLEDLEDFKRRIEDKLEDLEMNGKFEGEDEF